MDMYLGMLNDTEKDRQCSRHREIEYGCHLNKNEMEIYKNNVSDICLSLKTAMSNNVAAILNFDIAAI